MGGDAGASGGIQGSESGVTGGVYGQAMGVAGGDAGQAPMGAGGGRAGQAMGMAGQAMGVVGGDVGQAPIVADGGVAGGDAGNIGAVGGSLGGRPSLVFQYLRQNLDAQVEPPSLDPSEVALLTSVDPPSVVELCGRQLGVSLAATVRGWWEQTGCSSWPPVAEGDIASTKDALQNKIRGETIDAPHKVEAVKAFEKILGNPNDIQACAVCGVEDFQEVVYHSWNALGVLKLDEAETAWFSGLPPNMRKYVCVYVHMHDPYWCHPELVNREGMIPTCLKCERSCIGPVPVRPPMSIAAGKHFVRIAYLPELTP